MPPTALIAEDEPLLAAALKTELRAAWPELQIVATVGDGASAVREALALQPDVLFFDIRMPGLSGLDAAVALAEAWPMNVNLNGSLGVNSNGTLSRTLDGTLDPPLARPTAPPFPALVFITAYDQYAVQAFDAQAIDYVLKPVQAARLQKTVSKVKLALASRSSIATYFEATLAQLRALASVALSTGANTASPTGANTPSPTGANMASPAGANAASHFGANSTGSPGPAPAPLRFIQASVGSSIRMVPVDDVLCFEAADKYVRVLTADHEYLIRTPLKDLLPQLDALRFWQVHRGTLVQAERIESVTRDEAGKLWLGLHGCAQKLLVSRLYAHLFKAM